MSCAGAADFTISQGKTLPVLEADASTCSAGAFDFTDGSWALTFTMEGPVTITGSATGDADGLITYSWATGDTDMPGTYQARFDGVRDDGKTAKFPTVGFLTVEIEAA